MGKARVVENVSAWFDRGDHGRAEPGRVSYQAGLLSCTCRDDTAAHLARGARSSCTERGRLGGDLDVSMPARMAAIGLVRVCQRVEREMSELG
jgi:hypothetical protein